MTARPALVTGALLVGLVACLALLSLVWTPHPALAPEGAVPFAPPTARHPLGADQLGRDVVTLLMLGAQTSLLVSLVAVGLGFGVGVPLGLFAAAAGGWADEAVGRLNDLVFAFPALLLAVLLTASLGPGVGNAILAIGLFNVPVFARVARGAALPLWRREFVQAARLAGAGPLAISARHILPNVLPLLIVQATIQVSLGIVAEAGLSYVGLGAQPPAASWGRMLADAQTAFLVAPWLAIVPGVAIALSVAGFNLLGEGARDALDPRLARAARSVPERA